MPVGAGGISLLVGQVRYGGAATQDRFAATLMAAIEDGIVADAVIAGSGREATALWQLRKACTEWCFAQGRLVPHDISLPPMHLPAFCARAAGIVAAIDPGARSHIYGHLGDGNLHNLVQTAEGAAVSEAVNALVVEMGGSVTAEPGMGRGKARWLPLVADAPGIAAMARLKAAFDPRGILNPRRVLGAG
ncbi:hypothetical protein EKE94_00625 [Mesobaculum littorinae]|uniref:FAD-binding oxidoreductase/transferase type 4 C-terminal domain-containing protein n=1 Tax=Mesobaculum littorinae TaxID=2486419 RepID=A0A438AKW0_9RHOB|nr:FAD-linked oxidase C-terminal domain-containing protein [Mesobaculum littorinae]RVV99236.1 hypothetical protein EKE94_00625 [Mesobaculum littorinae]